MIGTWSTPGRPVDRLLGLLLDQAGHRHRAPGGNLERVSARRVWIEGDGDRAGWPTDTAASREMAF
jgi:hypothetical protein